MPSATRGQKVVAIVQARMGSSRLPGKVLRDLGGKTILSRVIERLRRSTLIQELVIATTTQPADGAIVVECERRSAVTYQGSEDDVLDRYYRAAQESQADVVVRITSDCPLIEPEITDRTIEECLRFGPDYASNALIRSFPRGLDTEVMTFQALERCWREAKEPYQRAHVTPYIYENPSWFRIRTVQAEKDYSQYRWTVDTPEDLEFVRAVYASFPGRDDFSWREVLDLLDRRPELLELNRHIVQKALREG